MHKYIVGLSGGYVTELKTDGVEMNLLYKISEKMQPPADGKDKSAVLIQQVQDVHDMVMTAHPNHGHTIKPCKELEGLLNDGFSTIDWSKIKASSGCVHAATIVDAIKSSPFIYAANEPETPIDEAPIVTIAFVAAGLCTVAFLLNAFLLADHDGSRAGKIASPPTMRKVVLGIHTLVVPFAGYAVAAMICTILSITNCQKHNHDGTSVKVRTSSDTADEYSMVVGFALAYAAVNAFYFYNQGHVVVKGLTGKQHNGSVFVQVLIALIFVAQMVLVTIEGVESVRSGQSEECTTEDSTRHMAEVALIMGGVVGVILGSADIVCIVDSMMARPRGLMKTLHETRKAMTIAKCVVVPFAIISLLMSKTQNPGCGAATKDVPEILFTVIFLDYAIALLSMAHPYVAKAASKGVTIAWA